jgi:hypothetical protein
MSAGKSRQSAIDLQHLDSVLIRTMFTACAENAITISRKQLGR